ncbi:MAG: anaerobic ribonucleoside-triphosphate reductase activating protein [Epsilonproteobacteria bacterium]|nr:MAG: anaerobic ribonucleoside-triphosphate reductase activating protein [Campylobacterota bacterium]
MIYFSYAQETLQAVPGEISISLSISGCSINCKGCHSVDTHKSNFGQKLTKQKFLDLLYKHKHISCVLFYGGEWVADELLLYVDIAKQKYLKTAIYTGLELHNLEKKFINAFDYVKTGKYIQKLGAINSKTTNQKFYKIIDGKYIDISSIFLYF